ncbi:hypothetical protein [Sphaerobacter sp.]|uniref:hypothetical protein n=1 Tax=Sphaerobacter sp. TaxID=2099654 RepID=UPI001D6941B7|nr:hypothetical protein [Sphaerobacter sp.]MBX5445453.1 hypothetical protein [Sphaerobacter sp.]
MSDQEDRLLNEVAADEEQIVSTLVDELRDSFLGYLHGSIGFDELTFEVFDTLQAVHAVRSGHYTVEYLDDEDTVVEAMEELTQEPLREEERQPRRRKKRR